MRFFCFAHLWWCHKGWASNILGCRCWRSQYPPWLKYWILIHYDTIEDGQIKTLHLFLSFFFRIVLFVAFLANMIYLSKILLHSFGIIWIITKSRWPCDVCHICINYFRNWTPELVNPNSVIYNELPISSCLHGKKLLCAN